MVVDDKFPTFDAAKNPNSLLVGGGGGGLGVTTNFQLLMLSSNLLKSTNFLYGGGWGVEGGLEPVDAESKSAKIPNSLYRGDGVGEG